MDVDSWLADLAVALPRQAALLRGLRVAVTDDPRLRTLELQGSLARGAADPESDLDAGIGADPAAWPEVAGAVAALVEDLAPVVGAVHHELPDWGMPHQRSWVEYADGVQLDLVTFPADRIRGRVPHAVVLHDPDGRLAAAYEPPSLRADAGDVDRWARLGWVALADMGKYLRRGSVWEALGRLAIARDHALQLEATSQGVDYPRFGLVSLLDAERPRLPSGLPETAAVARVPDLAAAGLACADLLERATAAAVATVGGTPPAALAAAVRARLGSAGA